MKLTVLIIIWWGASGSLAQIIKDTPKTNDLGTLVEATVDILSRCYGKEVNTVGLAGTSDGILLEALLSQKSFPMVLIGNDTHNETRDKKSRHKLQQFVVTASSSKQLKETFKKIKGSLWWNHMATFLILGWQSSNEQGCANAFRILWTAWEMNLLKALYVCSHRTKGRLIYTFNPYTSEAPGLWHRENTYRGKNDHPWTLLSREYDDDERICESLEFDKTTDLGGYQIYSTVKEFPPALLLNLSEKGMNVLGGSSGYTARVIFHALNATIHLKVHDHRQSPALLDSKGNDIAMDTVNGISDFVLQPRLQVVVQNFTTSYASFESGFNIVTQYSGDQSQLNKLVTVLDRSSRCGLCVVVITTVIFFKCFLRQSVGTAILNTLRIIANSSLTKVPKNHAARMYLAGLFILVVTIVGIYQGLLSSLLTKTKPLPNVETMQDLVERGYTIHVTKHHAYLVAGPEFTGRVIEHKDIDLAEFVLRDSSAAWLGGTVFVSNATAELKLHISRDIVFKSSVVYVIREDWPLEERFNKIIAAQNGAYITQYVVDKDWKERLSVAKFNEFMAENVKCNVMTLSELTFAFAFLGIGLACATVCFIVEIVVSQPRSGTRIAGSGSRNWFCRK